VLPVEDDPWDVLMTTEAFELSPYTARCNLVGDGEQAMRCSCAVRRSFTGAPRPGLGNPLGIQPAAPQRPGVLAELKADPDPPDHPVVIFSTSQAETDIGGELSLFFFCNAHTHTSPSRFGPDFSPKAIRQVDDFFLPL